MPHGFVSMPMAKAVFRWASDRTWTAANGGNAPGVALPGKRWTPGATGHRITGRFGAMPLSRAAISIRTRSWPRSGPGGWGSSTAPRSPLDLYLFEGLR